MKPKSITAVQLLAICIVLAIKFASSDLLPALSPQYDAGKWYAQVVVSPNSPDVHIIETTIVERHNAVQLTDGFS